MAGMPIRSQNHPVGPSSWTALSSTLKLVMLLMSVLVLLAIPHTMAATTVYVGSSFTSNVDDVTNSMSYYVTGIIAPAALGSNSIISIAPSIISSGSAQGNGVWSAFSSQSGVVALFGPGGTQYMYSIYDNLDLFSYSFMTFAPMAQSVDDSGLTVFLNPLNQVYWTMPSEQAQSVGLLLLLMERSLFPINQLLYRTKSVGIGYTASLLYKHIMPSQVKLNSLDEPFWWKSTYESSVEAKPGVVYMFGMSEADATTHTWVENLLVDPNLIEQNTTIVFTFEMQYFMLTQFTDLASKNTATLPVANFISSAPVPGVDSTEYTAAQDFMSQAQGIIPAGSSSCLLNYMMAGWVNGWGLVQAIHKFSGSSISDKSYFFTALIGAQFSFVVSDLFVGSMSGQGSATAANQGALTNCQHGGNNVWFHSFVKKGATYDTAPIEGQMFQYGLGLCANLIAPNDMISEIVPYQQLIKVPQAVHAMAFSTSDNPMIESMCEQMTDVVSRVGNRNLYWHESTHAYSLHCLDTVELNASADFTAFAQSYIVDALYGVIPDSLVGTSITTSNFIVDFMPQTTQPHIHQANLIYLFPTLEQELYQLTSYLGNVATTNSVVCAVTRSSATISPAIIGLLTSTLRTFGISTVAENLLQVNGAIGSSIPKSCTHTFVLGIDADDAALLVDYLTATPQAIVLTAFDDLTKFYAEIQTAMAKAPTSLTNRLLFATNLPPWTGVATAPTPADASLSSIHDFLASVPATLHTPAALRAFITAKVYDLLTSWWGADAGSSQDALYGNVSLTVDGLVFGPFRATCVLPDGESSNQGACVGNYGAQDIAVWSYTRVVAPATTPVLATATTPTLIYLSSGVQALGDHARSRPSTIEDELSRSEVEIPLAVADAHAATNCVEPFAESSAEQKHQSAASPSSASSGASGPKKSLNYAARTRMAYAAQEDAHEDDASDDTDEVLDKLSLFLFIMLGVVALALIVFGILMCGAGRHLQYLFLSCCGGESKPRNWRRPLDAMDAESVAMDEERAELQRAAQDTSRAPASSPVPIVFVFVDVEHFHSLLVREPAAMGRANDHYRRVVREAIIHHDCFEVRAVESMFLITCPSASAGVALVREMVERTEKLSKSDARALSTVYTALGCSPGGPAGLRLRLGMHRGAASFSSAGVVQCCGRAVDTAVCVAYSIVCPGQLLLTDPARYALINEGAKEVDELIVRGSRQLSLMTEEKMEMFELHLSPSTADGGEGSLGQEGAIQAARVLETGTEALHPTTAEICREQLVGHFDGIPDDLKMADVRSINQRLGLDVLHMEDYTDDNAYTEALLSAVADRIAAMVESRCGVVQLQKQRQHAASPHFGAGSPMGSLLISKPSSPALVSMGRPTLREAGSPTVRFDESVFRVSPTVGPSCGSPKFSSWRMQDHRRVSQDGGTRTLRHFAYSRDSSHTVDELLQRRATGSFTHRSSSSSGEDDS